MAGRCACSLRLAQREIEKMVLHDLCSEDRRVLVEARYGARLLQCKDGLVGMVVIWIAQGSFVLSVGSSSGRCWVL